MNGAELLLVVVAAIAVTAIARRRNLQAPLVLVVLGLLVSLIPGLPRLEIEPDLILTLVLPPLLYSTAVEFSVVNFMRNLWPILGLGVLLVILTAAAVGFTASAMVPELTLAAGLVLGSVVGPPDAVTAAAVGRRLGLPKRVMTILTGESLVNDAAALTLFAITTVAVTGETAFIASPLLYFGYGVTVGVLVGVLLARIVQATQKRLNDPALQTVIGLVLPFTCYFVAEELHASGVIAVVIAGFVVGHRSARNGYAARIQERDVWRSLDVLLEAFVFAYMGLQMKFIFAEVRETGHSLTAVLLSALGVLLVVLLIRPAYVLGRHAIQVWSRRLVGWHLRRHPGQKRAVRRRRRQIQNQRRELRADGRGGGPERAAPILPLKQELVISWTGMRGVVTLAAAAGIPLTVQSGEPFPGRPTIQVAAFVVAVGTLLIQGTTLPAFIRRLRIEPDDPAEEKEQIERAHQVTRQAAKSVITQAMADAERDGDSQVLQLLTARLQNFQEQRQELHQATEEVEDAEATAAQDPGDQRRAKMQAYNKIRFDMLEAQRRALTVERDQFRLADDTYRELMEELDYDQAATNARSLGRML